MSITTFSARCPSGTRRIEVLGVFPNSFNVPLQGRACMLALSPKLWGYRGWTRFDYPYHRGSGEILLTGELGVSPSFSKSPMYGGPRGWDNQSPYHNQHSQHRISILPKIALRGIIANRTLYHLTPADRNSLKKCIRRSSCLK